MKLILGKHPELIGAYIMDFNLYCNIDEKVFRQAVTDANGRVLDKDWVSCCDILKGDENFYINFEQWACLEPFVTTQQVVITTSRCVGKPFLIVRFGDCIPKDEYFTD